MKAKGVWLVPTIVVTQPGALDADPVQDIHALRTIGFVMKGGVVVRDDRRDIVAR